MASISERTLPSGTVQIRLTYRLHGKQQQVCMSHRATAEMWHAIFEAMGPAEGERRLRAEAAETVSPTPTAAAPGSLTWGSGGGLGTAADLTARSRPQSPRSRKTRGDCG